MEVVYYLNQLLVHRTIQRHLHIHLVNQEHLQLQQKYLTILIKQPL